MYWLGHNIFPAIDLSTGKPVNHIVLDGSGRAGIEVKTGNAGLECNQEPIYRGCIDGSNCVFSVNEKTLQSQALTHRSDSHNQSSGWSMGASIGTGGVSVNASVNKGHGNSQGNGIEHRLTHIGNMNSVTDIGDGNNARLIFTCGHFIDRMVSVMMV